MWVENKSGKLPLEVAVREGEVRTVEVLVQHMEGLLAEKKAAGVFVWAGGGRKR
jgi:hypothetical protein